MLKNMLKNLKRLDFTKKAYELLFRLVGKFPPNQRIIVFESFLGKQYSCNPRAVYEFLKENHPEYDMYWSVDPRYSSTFEDKGVRILHRFSLKWLFVMARAKYWVFNSRMPGWIPKPKHTVYVQTWHGTPLKKLAADMEEVHMPGTTTEKYKENFLQESARWDYLVSPNRYSSDIFRSAFDFQKTMIESGYPRNDFLYNCNNKVTIESIKRKLSIPSGKKVILYAPTWRDNEFYQIGKYKFNLKLDLDLMREKLGNDYIVLLRMHYLIAENMDLSLYNGFAYNLSDHEDIRELYLISDLLITDYSSVFFDYANLRRPMIFYVYDIEEYRDKLRGFYFDFENSAPGPLVKTTEQCISEILQLEQTDYKLPDNFEEFYSKFCYLESGDSSKRVAEKVFS